MSTRFTILILSLVLSFSSLNAQNMTGVFLGPAVPVGTLSQQSNIGFAIGGNSRFFPLERLAVGVNSSFQFYIGRGTNPNFFVVPIRASIEYFFTDEGAIYRPFIGGDLGVYLSTHSNTFSVAFGVTPSVGISFELSDYISAQIQTRYNVLVSNGIQMIFEPSVGFTYNLWY